MSVRVLNANDLASGKKTKQNLLGVLTMPIQLLPYSEKDEQWTALNADFIEWQGLKMLMRKSRKLLKFYKAAKGIIDRTDYGLEESNDYNNIVKSLEHEGQNMLELKFFPLIPTVIDSFRTEFSKRQSKLMFQTIDPVSTSEMEKDKEEKLEKILLSIAEVKLLQKLQEQGANLQDPQVQQQLQPDALKQLPELQQFYRTGYRNIYAEWAQHQKAVDDQRFHMDELEDRAFFDKLCSDSEFWHFKMKENDYELELWNPLLTFYNKSPDRRWVSQSNWVGNIDLMSISDVCDKYGWLMTADQLKSLETLYPIRAAGYLLDNVPNDGSYYDSTRDHDWNVQQPSLQYRQFMSRYDNTFNNGDVVQQILLGTEDLQDYANSNLLRVSTIYWRSQRKVGHLTKIGENGLPEMDIVDESYVITDKPEYDTTLYKEKSRYNLVYGEHIDWTWINDIWGCVKIGPNRPAWWGVNNPGGMQPMYLGVTKNKPGRIPFQFKGDDDLYGVKLPVEGAIFGDRNTLSVPMVARMMPSQIGYNLVCNQISDILIDELGTIVLIDQNALPKHSLGEDWGPNNYQRAFLAMKNFQMLPLDTSIQNLSERGGAVNFQHYQSLDLSQTNRLMSRIQIANYFQQQCFGMAGFNAQRLAQPVGQTTSAKEYEESIRNSYDQTEMHFVEHCDYLMPRVHQMRTELAQYYLSKNPSVTLQYVNDNNEKIIFNIDGTKLMMRDINVFPVTKVNTRQILKNIQQMLLSNNTTGATIFDLGRLLQIDDMADLNDQLKAIEDRTQKEKQQELEQQQQQFQAQQEQEEKLKQFEWAHDDIQREKDRQTELLKAEIISAGRATNTMNPEDSESAYTEALDKIQSSQQWQEEMNFKKQQHTQEVVERQKDREMEEKKIAAENARTHQQLATQRHIAAIKPKTTTKK
jgi:hypothetical protein